MKSSTMFKVVMLFIVFGGTASTLRAQSADPSLWLGVWNGTLEGQPAVTLTLAEENGQLGGTVVLNVILGQPPNAHVGGTQAFLVTHPQLEGNTLSFQVTRTSDAKLLQFGVKSVDSDRLELRCLNCEGSPTATLVKFRP